MVAGLPKGSEAGHLLHRRAPPGGDGAQRNGDWISFSAGKWGLLRMIAARSDAICLDMWAVGM